MRRWYVVNTRFREEHLAKVNLRRQGFETYLPQYLKRRRHARKTEWLPAPLFSRYLFVALDVAVVRWRAVQSTIGVHRLICRGDSPLPTPRGVVEEIRSREDENGMVEMLSRRTFSNGQSVQVISGALCDRVGLFDCPTDDERVVILLDMLGRETRVHMPLEAIRACA